MCKCDEMMLWWLTFAIVSVGEYASVIFVRSCLLPHCFFPRSRPCSHLFCVFLQLQKLVDKHAGMDVVSVSLMVVDVSDIL